MAVENVETVGAGREWLPATPALIILDFLGVAARRSPRTLTESTSNVAEIRSLSYLRFRLCGNVSRWMLLSTDAVPLYIFVVDIFGVIQPTFT